MMRGLRSSGRAWMALKRACGERIDSKMSPRAFFAILIAVAMLFGPLAMPSGHAMAAVPSDHQSQMIGIGHCKSPPVKGNDSKSTSKSCCVAMCTAIATAPLSPVEPVAFSRSVGRPARDRIGRGFLAKLPTPPPRIA